MDASNQLNPSLRSDVTQLPPGAMSAFIQGLPAQGRSISSELSSQVFGSAQATAFVASSRVASSGSSSVTPPSNSPDRSISNSPHTSGKAQAVASKNIQPHDLSPVAAAISPLPNDAAVRSSAVATVKRQDTPANIEKIANELQKCMDLEEIDQFSARDVIDIFKRDQISSSEFLSAVEQKFTENMGEPEQLVKLLSLVQMWVSETKALSSDVVTQKLDAFVKNCIYYQQKSSDSASNLETDHQMGETLRNNATIFRNKVVVDAKDHAQKVLSNSALMQQVSTVSSHAGIDPETLKNFVLLHAKDSAEAIILLSLLEGNCTDKASMIKTINLLQSCHGEISEALKDNKVDFITLMDVTMRYAHDEGEMQAIIPAIVTYGQEIDDMAREMKITSRQMQQVIFSHGYNEKSVDASISMLRVVNPTIQNASRKLQIPVQDLQNLLLNHTRETGTAVHLIRYLEAIPTDRITNASLNLGISKTALFGLLLKHAKTSAEAEKVLILLEQNVHHIDTDILAYAQVGLDKAVLLDFILEKQPTDVQSVLTLVKAGMPATVRTLTPYTGAQLSDAALSLADGQNIEALFSGATSSKRMRMEAVSKATASLDGAFRQVFQNIELSELYGKNVVQNSDNPNIKKLAELSNKTTEYYVDQILQRGASKLSDASKAPSRSDLKKAQNESIHMTELAIDTAYKLYEGGNLAGAAAILRAVNNDDVKRAIGSHAALSSSARKKLEVLQTSFDTKFTSENEKRIHAQALQGNRSIVPSMNLYTGQIDILYSGANTRGNPSSMFALGKILTEIQTFQARSRQMPLPNNETNLVEQVINHSKLSDRASIAAGIRPKP